VLLDRCIVDPVIPGLTHDLDSKLPLGPGQRTRSLGELKHDKNNENSLNLNEASSNLESHENSSNLKSTSNAVTSPFTDPHLLEDLNPEDLRYLDCEEEVVEVVEEENLIRRPRKCSPSTNAPPENDNMASASARNSMSGPSAGIDSRLAGIDASNRAASISHYDIPKSDINLTAVYGEAGVFAELSGSDGKDGKGSPGKGEDSEDGSKTDSKLPDIEASVDPDRTLEDSASASSSSSSSSSTPIESLSGGNNEHNERRLDRTETIDIAGKATPGKATPAKATPGNATPAKKKEKKHSLYKRSLSGSLSRTSSRNSSAKVVPFDAGANAIETPAKSVTSSKNLITPAKGSSVISGKLATPSDPLQSPPSSAASGAGSGSATATASASPGSSLRSGASSLRSTLSGALKKTGSALSDALKKTQSTPRRASRLWERKSDSGINPKIIVGAKSRNY
jgi:hypothetical protein